MPAEWDQFKFQIGDGNELTTVRHVAHVPAARRIVEDKRLKAGLVYDNSKLNESRISVAWVSANTWSLGSIYGTVEFQFAWSDLVAGQNIYWVEATDYRPKAYRLLLSSRNIQSRLIVPYDPTKHEGPLRLKDGKYYWNSWYTSEFMIEDDLLLDRCTGLKFIEHHSDYCRPFGAECEDRKSQPSSFQTGGRMLAFILGNGLHDLDQHLRPSGIEPEFTPLLEFTPLQVGYSGIVEALGKVNLAGHIRRDSNCQNIVRSSLISYGAGKLKLARDLLALISSEVAFRSALVDIVRDHFNDPTWEPFVPVVNDGIPF